MGVALKAAGVARGQLASAKTCGYAKFTQHPGSDMHFIRAQELADALDAASIPGLRKTEKVTPSTFDDELNGRKGIVFFKDYWSRDGDTQPTGDHIDVWDRHRVSGGGIWQWLGFYGGKGAATQVLFWEVK